ncbi:MAG: Vitamin B12 dependent methionine synthase activation subunit [Eubacteriales bacterium]|nr:Vitamin B12 dependent methionine synthase activation subunit [Eubacteriales bacterium]
MRLDKEEIRRLLGIKQPDTASDVLIDGCIPMLQSAAAPAYVAALCSVEAAGEQVLLDGYPINSATLLVHLTGCKSALLMAATLGQEVDRLLLRESKLEISRAVVLQAAAAAAIEAFCDEAQAQALAEYAPGLYMKPRFSPGYGDFSLSHQGWLLERLQAQKRIGLFLTEAQMLTPTKSVTAVIGLTAEKTSCSEHKCATCGNTNCAFKKE